MLKPCLAVFLLCTASLASAQTGIPILSAVQEAEGATEHLQLATACVNDGAYIIAVAAADDDQFYENYYCSFIATAGTRHGANPQSGATGYSFVLNYLRYDTCVLRSLRRRFQAVLRGANAI